MTNQIGEQVKKKRLELGLSQEKLARLLDCSMNTIRNWEKGCTEPDASKFLELQNMVAK